MPIAVETVYAKSIGNVISQPPDGNGCLHTKASRSAKKWHSEGREYGWKSVLLVVSSRQQYCEFLQSFFEGAAYVQRVRGDVKQEKRSPKDAGQATKRV
jgi:hypothetical protein